MEYADCSEFFRKAFVMLNSNGVTGDYAEFGCWGATTFCVAYRMLVRCPYQSGPCHLWGFDSFAGLPPPSLAEDEHPAWVEGSMATSLDEFHGLCRARGVPRDAYTTVAGFYDQSLQPNAPGPRPDKIRLAYIDCDLYSSTKSVLEFLLPRLQHGMVLAFDDYYCYSTTMPSGERLAMAEAFANHARWRLVPFLQIGWHGMSFVVEEIGPDKRNGNLGAQW